jgi:rhamnose utilization protein RhaD (predicted bifunctional aldolase and dehydrogenase)
MKFEMSNFQALAANLPVQGEVCDLPYAKLSTQAEADMEMPSLIVKVGATTIAEIDRLIAELQEAKNYLQSEGKRIEQETVRYTNLAQMALFTAKIIFDAVSQWHPASNQQNASDVTAASTENDISAFVKSHHGQSDVSELGQAADAIEGTPHAKV